MDPNAAHEIFTNYVGGVAATATTASLGLAVKYRHTLRAWVSDALGEMQQRSLSGTRERMAANAETFLGHVAGELAKHEAQNAEDDSAERLGERLGDPATAVSFYAALFAASQTSSEERHAALAKLVVARMGAEADSARAAESAFAVEATARLGREHLYVLGVLALVRHVGQLPPIALPPEVAETYTHYTEAGYSGALDTLRPLAPGAARPFVAAFVRWAEQHGVEQIASQTVALHLASAGCLTPSGSGLRFRDAILPPDDGFESGHPQTLYTSWIVDQVEAQLRDDPVGVRLVNVWERSLAYLSPTPAGVLIGLAVHDTHTGENQVRRWEWGPNDGRPWHPGVRP